jgi:hypothetical protein
MLLYVDQTSHTEFPVAGPFHRHRDTTKSMAAMRLPNISPMSSD